MIIFFQKNRKDNYSKNIEQRNRTGKDYSTNCTASVTVKVLCKRNSDYCIIRAEKNLRYYTFLSGIFNEQGTAHKRKQHKHKHGTESKNHHPNIAGIEFRNIVNIQKQQAGKAVLENKFIASLYKFFCKKIRPAQNITKCRKKNQRKHCVYGKNKRIQNSHRKPFLPELMRL